MVSLKLPVSYDLTPHEEKLVTELLSFEGRIATQPNIRKFLEKLLEDTLGATGETLYITVLLSKAIEEKYNFKSTVGSEKISF